MARVTEQFVVRRLLIVAVAAVVIVIDQLTKTWAEHQRSHHVVWTLWIEPTLNHGAAFGLGGGATPIVETIVVVLVVGLLLVGRRASRRASIPMVVALGLLLGGAFGNLIDRLFRHNHGGVVDFIDIAQVGSKEWWPVFNLADTAIVIGAILLVLTYQRSTRRAPAPTP